VLISPREAGSLDRRGPIGQAPGGHKEKREGQLNAIVLERPPEGRRCERTTLFLEVLISAHAALPSTEVVVLAAWFPRRTIAGSPVSKHRLAASFEVGIPAASGDLAVATVQVPGSLQTLDWAFAITAGTKILDSTPRPPGSGSLP